MPDPRRFRMTMELDGCEPLEEDTWAGRRIEVGEAIVRMGDPVPRCVVTTLDPDRARRTSRPSRSSRRIVTSAPT